MEQKNLAEMIKVYRDAYKKYRNSRKYKEARKKYKESEEGKAYLVRKSSCQKKYRESKEGKAYLKEYRKSKKGKESFRLGQKKYAKKNKIKIKAHDIVNRKIRSGKLQRDSCVICNSNNAEAHHEDYNNPLDIIWLCSNHHKKWHFQRRNHAKKNH